MELVPFDPVHFDTLDPDPAMAVPYEDFLAADLHQLVNPAAWTAFDDDRTLACGGLLPAWPGRAIAWAIIAPGVDNSRFLVLDRHVRRVLQTARRRGYERIETVIDPFYPGGRAMRWALSLGFRIEAHMRGWGIDGRDMCLVAITGDIE